MHEPRIHHEVQQTNVVVSNSVDMGNTNVIPYEQYAKHNDESVAQNDESPENHNMCDVIGYSAYVPDDTLTTRIKILKDQVTIYQQRAKFELTEREQKMDWQMCAYITETNRKEEALRREIRSLQNQIEQIVQQKQEIQDSVTALKLDFQSKESKLLSDFSNLKALKNKLENKLYTQGQTIQTAQMMQKHIRLKDEHSDKDLGVTKRDFFKYISATQPALYDANVMLKPDHAPLTCRPLRRLMS